MYMRLLKREHQTPIPCTPGLGLCSSILKCYIENRQFQIQIQIWKERNQNFEREFKICDRNEATIDHSQNAQNCMYSLVLFITVAFC